MHCDATGCGSEPGLAARRPGAAGPLRQSLARGAGRHFQAGSVRQTIVEMESAFLFVTAAGQGACLAVLADANSDIGLIAYEMAMLVKRVGQTLSSPMRPVAAPSDVG
jgi:hypothetical protein